MSDRLEWFGGAVGRETPAGVGVRVPAGVGARVPAGARPLVVAPLVWSVDGYPARVVTRGDRSVAVFGSCSATDAELVELLAGLADRHLTAFAGSYVLVEASPESLVVMTDPAGAVPIFLRAYDGGTYWGSSARALASLAPESGSGSASGSGSGPGLRGRVDVERLAARLPESLLLRGFEARGPSQAYAPGNQPALFSDVEHVPPGHRLELRPGRPPSLEPCWAIGSTSFARGAERLRSAVTAGVRTRLEGLAHVTADCSGGIDSTTIALLCSALGPIRGTEVTAITAGPGFPASGGDQDAVLAVDRAYPELRRRSVVVGPEELPYGRLDTLPPTDEPPRSVVVAARMSHVCRVLRDLGSELHLTGDGADALFVPPPGALAGLAGHAPRARYAWRRLAGWAYLHGESPWELRRHASPLEPETLALQGVRLVARGAASDLQLMSGLGIRWADPYLDNQVVDAALCVPFHTYASPWAYKPLLATAFEDLLPAATARRATKGSFLADHYHGIRRHRHELLGMLDGELAALLPGALDLDRVRAAVDDAAAAISADLPALEGFFGAEAWLRALDRDRPIAWEEPR